jgi:hypothetical protein
MYESDDILLATLKIHYMTSKDLPIVTQKYGTSGSGWDRLGPSTPPYTISPNSTRIWNYDTLTGATWNVPPNDISRTSYTRFTQRYLNDYERIVPTLPESTNQNVARAELYTNPPELEIIYGRQSELIGTTTFTFDLDTSIYNGTIKRYQYVPDGGFAGPATYTSVHSNPNGTYQNAAGVDITSTLYGDHRNLYRTYIAFNTAGFDTSNGYFDYVIKDAKLKLKNFGRNDGTARVNGSVHTGGSAQNIWDAYRSNVFFGYLRKDEVPLNEEYILDLNLDEIQFNTDIKMCMTYTHNLNVTGSTRYTEFMGFDFSEFELSITLEPYMIDGIKYISAPKGAIVQLYANKNTDIGEIVWGTDSGFTNIIGTGQILEVDTTSFNNGDIVYGCIMYPIGLRVSTNILEVYMDVYDLDYNTLPEREITNHIVDLDYIYFKYHKCISGVCYTYVRELDDAYEQNIQVSDGEGIGSYNLYSEFDIIDEFFSNSHEVEVVARYEDINFEENQKRLDNQLIHEGTRVLVYSTPPSENDGIYVADYNLMLHKTDELDTADKAFRYKAHVNAGTFLDYEFHTYYYDIELANTFEDEDLYGVVDGSVYSDEIWDYIGLYSDELFDSNNE